MPKREYVRQIITFGDYFKEFKKEQPQHVLRKIYQIFLYIMTLQVVPKTFLKSIEGVPGLFEIRIEESGNISNILLHGRGESCGAFQRIPEEDTKNAATRDRTGKTNYERIFQEKGGFAT